MILKHVCHQWWPVFEDGEDHERKRCILHQISGSEETVVRSQKLLYFFSLRFSEKPVLSHTLASGDFMRSLLRFDGTLRSVGKSPIPANCSILFHCKTAGNASLLSVRLIRTVLVQAQRLQVINFTHLNHKYNHANSSFSLPFLCERPQQARQLFSYPISQTCLIDTRAEAS